MSRIRTRFAPSPTGLLHLGGVRTALFNYLFAKHHQGDFIVRFEDTDLERSDLQLISKQLADLKWLGIISDATVGSKDQYAPYLQSQRLSYYRQYAKQLITTKKAYYCFCTKEELNIERKKQLANGKKAPKYNRKCLALSAQDIEQQLQKKHSYCIRLKIQFDQNIVFNDLVYGQTTFSPQHIEDFVLIKANGYPTYNFAVVIDDHLMEITHILRGSDHLTNTAKQIALYQAYQWTIPQFGHLTLLRFKEQKKMSKRLSNPHQYLHYYQQQGYLAKATFNYLALLGWTPDKFQEVFIDPQDLIAKFDGQNLNKAQSTFSLVKLDWINHKHIVAMPNQTFIDYGLPFCQQLQTKRNITPEKLKAMMLFFQKEIRHFNELSNSIESTFFPTLKATTEHLNVLKNNVNLLNDFVSLIQNTNWTETHLKDCLLKLSKQYNLTGKSFFLPLRLAVSGLANGPQMEKFLFFLGRQQIINNVSQQLKWIKELSR